MLTRSLALLCAFALIVPAAAAQEDGVTVDPGSPSGKEYALPIDRAREEAATRDGKGDGSRKAPLFGEGVRGEGAGSGAGGDDRTSGGPDGAASEPAVDRPTADLANGPEAEQAALRTRAADAEGGLGVGASITAAIAILLAGGLIGLWLRRRATS